MRKCLFLLLVIPFNVSTAALIEEELVINKEILTPPAKEITIAHPETILMKETFTSPYQSLSQGDTRLLKPISKIEEKQEKAVELYFQVIIPYKIRLKFDENLYHEIKREREKAAKLEKRQWEDRRKKILLEKQKLEEEEEKKVEELKKKIAKEEREKFEEKIELLEEDIEKEMAIKKAKREEEERIKELAAEKIKEEERRKIEEREKIAKEKVIKEQEEKRKAVEEEKLKALEEKQAKQKEKEEQEKLVKQKKEDEELIKKQAKEEKKRKQEEERKKLAEYKEFTLDEMLKREMPLGSKLNIDGKKVIDIKIGNSEYLDSKRRKNNEKPPGFSSGINIQQELTVKLQGVVKERINVQVDYSDVDHNKQQKFYINYQGTPREIVQKVEFGDVKFTAPGTEFVVYNPQVFGVSAEAKVGNQVKLWGIASRSKGLRATKEFYGDKRMVNINRAETTYTSQKYYHLLPKIWCEDKNVKLPITLEAVYIDDKNGNNNNPPKYIGEATAIVSIGTNTAPSYIGRFDIQYEGQDYVFDSDSQILTFKQNICRDYIVGVVFKDKDGKYFPQEYSGNKNAPATILLIEPGVALVEYDVFEMRNHYSVGENIPTDTELKLEIVDRTEKNFFDKNNDTIKNPDEYYYLQIFGLDNNGDGRIDDDKDNDYIDHTAGIIKFPDLTPFDLRGTETNPFINTHIELKDYLETLSVSYNPSDDYSKQHKYTLRGSYTTRVKSYMLGFDIVEDSEQISVDGKLLTRDTDYFIDYETGFLTFMPHIDIKEYTKITINYEYTPFIGTRYQNTIAGLRGEWTPNTNFSMGSTYLYEGGPALKKIPKVSEPMLGNLQVIDVSSSIKLTNMLKNLFNLENNLPVEMTISGEVAKSFKNKNNFGAAIIDSMEGVEEERRISMDEKLWQLGSLPETERNAKRGKLFYRKDSHGDFMTAPPYRNISEISGPYDYKENVKWEEDDSVEEEVLRLYYTDFGTNSWISLVQPLSTVPLDFTKYTHLEIWLKEGDLAKIEELYIDLGEVSEHAEGTGTINRPPKTEDIITKDYILNRGEDIGWEFKYPDNVVTKIGAENNQLDTEDLDGDGILSTKEEYFVLKGKEFKEKVKIRNQIGDWQLWSIPLARAEIGTRTPRWSAIKHLRLRFKAGTQTPTEGEIGIGGIAIIGSSRWQIGTVTPTGAGTFNISSKNAEDDAYPSIRDSEDYNDLYPDEEMKREEALVLKYELAPGRITVGTQTTGTRTIYSKGYTYATFQSQQNYNNYKYLKFWLYGDKSGGKFLIRFGGDENNYFGFTLPIDFLGWKLISIDLDDFKKELIYLIEEGKKTGTNTPPYNYTQVPFGYEAKNNPSFENIKWISLGIENLSTTQSIAGEIYVNDIHLAQARKSEGLARKVSINTKFKDYLSIDLNEKIIDGEFESLGRAPQNDNTQRQEVNVNFTKIKFLPLSYQWSKDIKELDPTKGTNLLNDNCGQTQEKYQKLSTNFKVKELAKKIKRVPDITISTWADSKDIHTARRNKKEDEIHQNLHGDTSYVYNYTFPKKVFNLLPTGQDLSLTSTYKHTEDWSKNKYQFETTKNERILTRTQDESLTLNFTPIKVFKGASTIKFAQTLKKIHNISQDDRKYYLSSRNLEHSFNRVVYSGIPFVSPRIDTGMIYKEAYTGTYTNRRKDINTTAHFGLTTESALNPFDWYPKVKHWPRYKLFTFTPEFTLDVTANYLRISTELGSWECIKRIYNDYYKGQLLKGKGPDTGQYPFFGGERTSASNKRIYKLRSDWYTPWKAVEKTSLNYTRTDDKSQNQSSLSQILTNSYDLDIGVNLLTALAKYSKLFGSNSSDRTYFNTKYIWTKTESNQTTIKTDLTPSLTWSRTWKEGVDTIFKLDHKNSKTKKEGGKKDFTLNTTPSFQINHDIKRPKPVKLPFGRKITLERRLKTTTIFKIELQKEGQDNRVTKNMDAYSLDMSGSYDLQKDITSTLGGKIGCTRDKLEKEKDFYGYEGRFRIEFRF